MESSPAVPAKQHRRNKSAVLRSMMPSSKRTKSDDKQPHPSPLAPVAGVNMSFLPPDHPHAASRVLSEIPANNNTAQPRRPTAGGDQPAKSLHKKSKSTVSLRSLGLSKESKTKDSSNSRPVSRRQESDQSGVPTKKKSERSLAAMFKGRSARDEEHEQSTSDKENGTPPEKYRPAPQTPIFAAYSTQPLEFSSTTKVPLNDHDKRQSLIQEIALYEPTRIGESNQRNFHGVDSKANYVRPKSEVIAGHDLANRFLDNAVMRKLSEERRPKPHTSDSNQDKKMADGKSRTRDAKSQKPIFQHGTEPLAVAKQRGGDNARISRVKDAVARIDRRTKTNRHEVVVESEKFLADFEAMLEAGNIQEVVRQSMRNLQSSVKHDLLHAYEQDLALAKGQPLGSDGSLRTDSADNSRPSTQGNSFDTIESKESASSKKSEKADSKKTRPRSRTFTFKKVDKSDTVSPSKKQKTDDAVDVKRFSQPDLTKTLLSTSPGTPSGSYFMGLAKRSSTPEDYVKYLQKRQSLADLEVGKLHKLRQLLRNETLAWVHKFIDLGGMNELVAVLHRLMDIEWREERDDQLLNEALLCLKGLCTCDLALSKLCEIEKTLFPALLAMLFDKEHKGPSEFTTRQIIVNLLLTHLEAAVRVPDILASRATTILSYLSDQAQPGKRNPLPFDLDVGPKRPYKVWNQEISNVTKEVFWVWLHPMNVIPFPHMDVQETSNPSEHASVRKCPPPRDLPSEAYTREFFPRARPPVPAAPYIGGVEWDATNYVATHVDLLNGLIASLPTREARNSLRAELRASGFERTMGERLRQCKEKYYGAVHDVLRTWVAAAICDGWDAKEVRNGPPKEDSPRKSPRKSPTKKAEAPPKLDAPPRLDLDMSLGQSKLAGVGKGAVDDWL